MRSVILNYIEGHACRRSKAHKNLLGVPYGSLKASECLLRLSLVGGLLDGYQSREGWLTRLAPCFGKQ